MVRNATFFGTLAGLGFLLGAVSGAIALQFPQEVIAVETHTYEHTATPSEFQRIDQPLGNKIAVTLGGVGLISLELWWFLFSKPTSQKSTAAGGPENDI